MMSLDSIHGGSFAKLDMITPAAKSILYRVLRKADNRHYAAKQYRLDLLTTRQINSAITQMRILASIDSPFVPAFRHAFVDKDWKSFFIVRQLEGAVSLRKLIISNKKQGKHFPESEVWKLLAHLCSAVALLHKNGIVHRDVQPEYIARTESGDYKVTDFTASEIIAETKSQNQAGTPYFQPPEVWDSQPYGLKRDIWSIGCVIYEMCTWQLPFKAQNMEGLYQKIKAGVYQTQIPNYSKELSALVVKCLKVKPEARPTALELLAKVEKVLEAHPEYKVTMPVQHGKFDLVKPIDYQHNKNQWQKAAQLQLPEPRFDIPDEVKPEQQTEEKKEQPQHSVVFQFKNPAGNQTKQVKLVFTDSKPKSDEP